MHLNTVKQGTGSLGIPSSQRSCRHTSTGYALCAVETSAKSPREDLGRCHPSLRHRRRHHPPLLRGSARQRRPSTWTDDTARAYQLWLSPCRRELLNPATDASLFLSSTFKILDFIYSFCSLPVNLYIFVNSRFKILFSLMKRSYLVQVNESQHPSAFLFMLRIAQRGQNF